MRVIGAAEVEGALGLDLLVERLREAFRSTTAAPAPHRHTIPTFGDHPGLLTLAPAWQDGQHLGLAVLTDYPDNAAVGLPEAMGAYFLLDARTGKPLALIDGRALIVRRTAAASALAAQYLARQDASRLLMVGAGAMAPHLIAAHCAVRPITSVLIHDRDGARAKRLAKKLDRRSLTVRATDDLAGAVAGAHVVCCATRSIEPIIHGDWLAEGTHLDLVGSQSAEMREVDDETVRRARLFVDTRDLALALAGDIVQPLNRGVITIDDIAGDLFDLARGERAGRRFYEQITLFKAVGTALEDLAAARAVFRQA
jgi:ornithine cyclodeaminase